MSTKATILLSENDEHWFQDSSDRTINLEIGAEHRVTPDGEGGYFIEIKEDSALGRAILELAKQS